MVIHFCASCDWSVPEQELLTGGAIKLENNRVYCARCVQAGLVTLPQVQAPVAARGSAIQSGIQPGVTTTMIHRGPNYAATPHAARSSALQPAVGRTSAIGPAVQPRVTPARGSQMAPAVQPQGLRGSRIGPAVQS